MVFNNDLIVLKYYRINCDYMYEQGYDGASNMASQFKGVQAIIINIRMHYTSIARHILLT
jgi:hypothetical protein